MGRAIGVADLAVSDEVASKRFLEEVEKLCEICEVPTLREYGIEEDAFLSVIEKMATDAVASGSPGNTRKIITQNDCKKIYEIVYCA